MLDREVRVTEKCSADDAARAFRVFPLRPRRNHPRYGHTPKADTCGVRTVATTTAHAHLACAAASIEASTD